MKEYTAAEIRKVVADGNPKFVALESETGQRLIPFNTRKELYSKEHAEKIFTYLSNDDLCPEGIYFVVTANDLGTKGVKIKYPYKKGNPANKKQPVAMEERPTQKEIYSFDKLLTLHQELAEYKAKVELKEMRIKELEQDVESLEDEISEMESQEKNPGLLGEGQGQLLMAKGLQLLEQMFTPAAPAALAEQAPPAKPVITYEQILNICVKNPAIAERLVNDIENYFNQPGQQEAAEHDQATGGAN